MMKCICALFFTFIFCTSCKEQGKTDSPKDNIESETKETTTSRVPDSMVRNIKQDRNGNILIASYRGVFLYDGKSFTNITSKISPPNFWDVLEDRKGNLWFATRDSGVYYYNGKFLPTGQADIQHFTTREGLADNFVCSIFEDKAGNVWFATGGGVSRYDGKSFRNFTTKEGLPNNDITTIMEDKTGKLWLGTRGDACLYDGKTFNILTNNEGKPFTNVWAIIEDKKGNVWLGADGLWRYDGRTFTKIHQRSAYSIIEDKTGNIWTTGEEMPYGDWVLSRYDEKTISTKNPTVTEIIKSGENTSLGENAFFGILEANDGSIWFGSLNGVYRYDGKTITDFK
jgi:ligand-binding sensor domain-containing protein